MGGKAQMGGLTGRICRIVTARPDDYLRNMKNALDDSPRSRRT
jgi:hypothetical protein